VPAQQMVHQGCSKPSFQRWAGCLRGRWGGGSGEKSGAKLRYRGGKVISEEKEGEGEMENVVKPGAMARFRGAKIVDEEEDEGGGTMERTDRVERKGEQQIVGRMVKSKEKAKSKVRTKR